MKKLLLTLLLGFTCFAAQSQQVVWEHNYGSSAKFLLKCTPLKDGGFAALFQDDIVNSISRLDSAGEEIWNIPFEQGLVLNGVFCMLKEVPGGLIVGLRKAASIADTSQLTLVKFNMQGIKLWTKYVPTGRTFNDACDLYIHSPNEYIVLGVGSNLTQTLAQGGGSKFLTAGIDSLGNTLWSKMYLDPLLTIDEPRNIIRYKTDGYFLCGRSSQNGNSNPRILKTDVEGNLLQDKLIENSFNITRYGTKLGSHILTAAGNIVITGFHESSDLNDRDLLVTKVDTSLNLIWDLEFADVSDQLASSNVLELADSSILLVTQRHNNNQIVLVNISSQGQITDTTYVTVASTTYSTSLKSSFLLPDSSLIYAGVNFIAKIANVGLPMPPQQFAEPPVGLPEQLEQLLATTLGAAYPNPTNSTVTIPYQLPKVTTTATLEIAEVATGRLVQRINLDLAAEQVELNIAKQAAGVYTYTLVIDNVPAGTKKLVIVK